MSIRKLTLAVVASLSLAGLTLGCNNAPDITRPTSLAVSSVSPASGAADSANDVSILGSGFQPGVTVTFDGAAAKVTYISGTSIKATTPVHPAGVVDVVVTNLDGVSHSLPHAFSYLPLTIVSVNPTAGPSGQVVHIVGTGIGAGVVVTMDGMPARVTHSDLSTIDAIAPDHAPGPVDVVVTNPAGGSATLAGSFVYQAPVSLSVSSNVVAAGSEITVSWTTNRSPAEANDDGVCLVDISSGALVWCYYTLGASSGAQTLTAPTRLGQYEFQYRIPDDFVAPYYHILARSSVTVVGPEASTAGRKKW